MFRCHCFEFFSSFEHISPFHFVSHGFQVFWVPPLYTVSSIRNHNIFGWKAYIYYRTTGTPAAAVYHQLLSYGRWFAGLGGGDIEGLGLITGSLQPPPPCTPPSNLQQSRFPFPVLPVFRCPLSSSGCFPLSAFHLWLFSVVRFLVLAVFRCLLSSSGCFPLSALQFWLFSVVFFPFLAVFRCPVSGSLSLPLSPFQLYPVSFVLFQVPAVFRCVLVPFHSNPE